MPRPSKTDLPTANEFDVSKTIMIPGLKKVDGSVRNEGVSYAPGSIKAEYLDGVVTVFFSGPVMFDIHTLRRALDALEGRSEQAV